MENINTNEISDLINKIKYLEGIVKIKFFTKDAFLLMTLIQKKSLSIKEAILLTEFSYRGFYILMDRMIENGFVKIKRHKTDKRVKLIQLSDTLQEMLT